MYVCITGPQIAIDYIPYFAFKSYYALARVVERLLAFSQAHSEKKDLIPIVNFPSTQNSLVKVG